jgi:hypothetical protein
MNYSGKMIKETLDKQGIAGVYLDKGLKKLGYVKLPESGLNDRGYDKLMTTIVEIYSQDASLIPVQYPELKTQEIQENPIQNKPIKRKGLEEKTFSKNTVKDDLNKLGRFTLNLISYIPTIFIAPTNLRRFANDDNFSPGFVGSMGGIITLFQIREIKEINPGLAAGIGFGLIGTNLISAGYEFIRNYKEKVKEVKKEKDVSRAWEEDD